MIVRSDGSIFDSGADALVNPVNCQGIDGAGLAKEFRARFPVNSHAYHTAGRSNRIHPGEVFVAKEPSKDQPWIFNFPTKIHWKDRSQPRHVWAGLKDLVRKIQTINASSTHKIESIAVPALGCGLGGLRWDEVFPLIEKAFEQIPEVTVHLYGPQPKESYIDSYL